MENNKKKTQRQREIDWNLYQLKLGGFQAVQCEEGIKMYSGSDPKHYVIVRFDNHGTIDEFENHYDPIVITEKPKNPAQVKKMMADNERDIKKILEEKIF